MAHWHQEIVESFLITTLPAFQKRAIDQKWLNEPMYLFIDSLISYGMFELACAEAGIDDKTAYAWKNENDTTRYHEEFVEVVKKARMFWAKENVKEIKIKGSDQWTSNAWLLERIMPDNFKEHKVSDTPSDDSNKLTQLLNKLTNSNEPNKPGEHPTNPANSSSDV